MSSTATPNPPVTASKSLPKSPTRAKSPAKSPAKESKDAPEKGSSGSGGRVTRSSSKKESFKWNTPADEFADDVASDAEEDVEFEQREAVDDEVIRGEPVEAEIDGERFQAHRTEDGEIIIHLGVEEAERFSVQGSTVKVLSKKESQDGGDGKGKRRGGIKKERKSTSGGIGGAEEGEEEISLESCKINVKEAEEDDEDEDEEKGGIKKESGSYSSKSSKAKSKTKFQCPKCDKIWNWPWELRRHVLTHLKEKERAETATYKCGECGRGFQWKRDLAQHMRLHTGEKLLVCSVCEKKFTTRQALLHQ